MHARKPWVWPTIEEFKGDVSTYIPQQAVAAYSETILGVVAAVGKCESCVFCAICKLGGKVWFWTFPPSGFSIAVAAVALLLFPLGRFTASLRGCFRTEQPIR